jgi:outer membrane immunogenic protein
LAFPTVLLYGTGGAAFQQLSVGAACSGSIESFCFAARSETASAVQVGWTVGGGVEAVLTGNWISKLEFRYADLGRFNHNFFAGTADEVDASVQLQTYTFLAGVGYKFNGIELPVIR